MAYKRTTTLIERMRATGERGVYGAGMGAFNQNFRNSAVQQTVIPQTPTTLPPGVPDPNADITAATAAAASNTSNTMLYVGIGIAAIGGFLWWRKHKKH